MKPILETKILKSISPSDRTVDLKRISFTWFLKEQSAKGKCTFTSYFSSPKIFKHERGYCYASSILLEDKIGGKVVMRFPDETAFLDNGNDICQQRRAFIDRKSRDIASAVEITHAILHRAPHNRNYELVYCRNSLRSLPIEMYPTFDVIFSPAVSSSKLKLPKESYITISNDIEGQTLREFCTTGSPEQIESAIYQIVLSTICMVDLLELGTNNLSTDTVIIMPTTEEYYYYNIKNKVYKLATLGIVAVITDLGYSYAGKLIPKVVPSRFYESRKPNISMDSLDPLVDMRTFLAKIGNRIYDTIILPICIKDNNYSTWRSDTIAKILLSPLIEIVEDTRENYKVLDKKVEKTDEVYTLSQSADEKLLRRICYITWGKEDPWKFVSSRCDYYTEVLFCVFVKCKNLSSSVLKRTISGINTLLFIRYYSARNVNVISETVQRKLDSFAANIFNIILSEVDDKDIWALLSSENNLYAQVSTFLSYRSLT